MLNTNFTPFPVLKTEGLILRQLGLNDSNEIFALRSGEKVNEFIDRPKTITTEEAIQFIEKIASSVQKNESVYWAITQKDSHRLIGTICLWNISTANFAAEIGYELNPSFQGKGIMQEALTTVISYGFEQMKLQTIEAYTHPGNLRSARLLEKNGFIKKQVEGNEAIFFLSALSFNKTTTPAL